jgi:hypothetical protein
MRQMVPTATRAAETGLRCRQQLLRSAQTPLCPLGRFIKQVALHRSARAAGSVERGGRDPTGNVRCWGNGSQFRAAGGMLIAKSGCGGSP